MKAVPRVQSRVLVCFAVKEEAASFFKFTSNREGVDILISGMGRQNAEDAVRKYLETHLPELVLTCGFAGGLNPVLPAGVVVFSTTNNHLRDRLVAAGAQPAKMFCASRVAITASEKAELRERTGADVVEMESEVIQSICQERGVLCATVRVISDTALENLPLDFNQLSKADMNLDFVKLAWAILKAPEKIGALIQLQKRCRFASGQLAQVLAKVIFR